MATVLKLLFKIKPGIELFREKRLAAEEPFKNKLGFTVYSRVAVLRGIDLEKTADLANHLDGPIQSKIEALGYSDFIIKWQNYFNDLPYCGVLHPFRKDLRAENEDETGDQSRIEQLDKILHKSVHHAEINEVDDHFDIDRVLGIIYREPDGLYCTICKTKETIEKNGTYKMDVVEELYRDRVPGDTWENLPRWFPKRK